MRAGHLGGILATADLAEDHRELVAPETRHRVGGAHAALQPAPDLDQQRIAREVAEAVIDALETVEVDQHQCEALAMAQRAGDRGLQAVLEQATVGQAGEGVVVGTEAQLLLGLLARGDVGHRGDEAFGRVHLADPHRRHPLHVEIAVLAPVPHLALPAPGSEQRGEEIAEEGRIVAPRAEHGWRAADHFLPPCSR